MSIFPLRLGLAFVLTALCLGGQMAHAQVAPLTYWIPGGPFGFGGNSNTDQGSNTYGDFPSFDARDAQGRFSYFNSPNGWFVGSEAGGMSVNGLNSAFGSFGSLNYQGMQFGYNLKNADGMPFRVYAGFDTLKYDPGFVGGPLAPFDSTSSTLPGYDRVHAGVEFKPSSNTSVSLDFGYTQRQSGRVDSDINSTAPPGASPFLFARP